MLLFDYLPEEIVSLIWRHRFTYVLNDIKLYRNMYRDIRDDLATYKIEHVGENQSKYFPKYYNSTTMILQVCKKYLKTQLFNPKIVASEITLYNLCNKFSPYAIIFGHTGASKYTKSIYEGRILITPACALKPPYPRIYDFEIEQLRDMCIENGIEYGYTSRTQDKRVYVNLLLKYA